MQSVTNQSSQSRTARRVLLYICQSSDGDAKLILHSHQTNSRCADKSQDEKDRRRCEMSCNNTASGFMGHTAPHTDMHQHTPLR